GLYESLAFLDAALRHVSDEAGARITLGYSRLILRKCDDAISHSFHSTPRLRETHAALSDKRLRNHRRFDNFRPGIRLQLGEPVAGLPDFVVRQRRRDRVHAVGLFSRATFEIDHLATDVFSREACHICGFRMTDARHKMTGPARQRITVTMLNDLRCRR